MSSRRFAYPRPYEELDAETRDAVDHAFKEVTDTLKAFGLARSWDDRAEHLVDAITEYVLESRDP